MNKTFYAAAVTTNLQCTAGRYEELLETGNSHNNLWGWRKDRAVGQIAVMSLGSDISSLSVKAGEFTKDTGDKLPEGAVKCAFIRETKAFVGVGRFDNKTRSSFPDVIWDDAPVSLKAKSVQPIWITFDIPAGSKTGVYKGHITLTDDKSGYFVNVPYSVQVLALTMPEPEDYYFDIELWQYPYRVASYYGLEPFGEKHTELLKKHMLIYKNMGGSAITASILHEPWAGQTYGEYPSMAKWTRGKDGKFTFDFTDFDKWVALNKEIGIGDKIVCYSLVPWSGKLTYYNEKKDKMKSVKLKPGKHKYKKIWRQFLKAFMEHTEEKGWFNDIYIGTDERGDMKKVYDFIDSVKNSEGKAFKKAAAIDRFSSKYYPVIDRTDSISIGSKPIKTAEKDFRTLCMRRAMNENLKTTVYTCMGHFPNSFVYSMPAESYWTPFYAASFGANGFLRWAYDAWVESPLDDTTHTNFEPGDCFLVYPDLADSEKMETHLSLRLEKLCQGIRDVNKLLYLSRQSADLCEKSHRILRGIKGDYAQTNKKKGLADERALRELPPDMDGVRNALFALSSDFLEFMS